MARNVLVVAAHADDEVLGCGGTVALHTRAGDHVTSVIACNGEAHRQQRRQSEAAARLLGVCDLRTLGLADQRLDALPLLDVITPLQQIVRELRPEVVYCQYGGDINHDHEVLFKALQVTVRPVESYVRTVYAFDTASSTEWAYPRTFVPDTWVDISTTLETKLEAMACYDTELREYPHPRSLRALRTRAEAWGVQQCLSAAEVFITIRRTLHDGQTPA
jgi:LmbE family N-acetylglucosaminyl deacetylase